MKLTPAKIIGVFLSVVHFVLFALFSITMNIGSQDAMAGMLWGVWKSIDFPISLFAYYGFVPTPMEWNSVYFVIFIYPYIVHGIFGTVWWFFIPMIIGNVFNSLLNVQSQKSGSDTSFR